MCSCLLKSACTLVTRQRANAHANVGRKRVRVGLTRFAYPWPRINNPSYCPLRYVLEAPRKVAMHLTRTGIRAQGHAPAVAPHYAALRSLAPPPPRLALGMLVLVLPLKLLPRLPKVVPVILQLLVDIAPRCRRRTHYAQAQANNRHADGF